MLARLILAALALPALAQAQALGTSFSVSGTQGVVAWGLSQRMLCYVFVVLQGNVGLMIGLAIAVGGLWQLARHGAMKTGLTMIVAGALFTALPSLVASAISGAAGFFYNEGISVQMQGWGLDSIQNIARSGDCEGNIPIDMSLFNEDDTFFTAPYTGGFARGLGSYSSNGGGGTPVPVASAAIGLSAKNPACMDMKNKPLPGATMILQTPTPILTDCVGFRAVNPATGAPSPHKGVDVVPSNGGMPPVKAAYAGKVTVSKYSGSAGNFVQVSNGNQTTNYFHMSGRNVNVGDTISAGQTLGTMGSTGHSTGPHLHFELYQNGTLADPCSVLGCPAKS